MTERFQGIVDNLVRWGEASDQLYAALIVGSQARENHQADEYSDLDIIMIVEDPALFLSSDQWLKDIGNFHVSFVENTIGGEQERRILFDNALDADFVIFPKSKIKVFETEDESAIFAKMLLKRGYAILIDKIGIRDRIKPDNADGRTHQLLTEQDFTNVVSDFWYHSVWTAKKLMRGELWTAKFCIDSYMKWKLLSIIECYAHLLHGEDYDTWHGGRFIEEWAEGWIVEKLSLCFSHYNKDDMRSALLSTMGVFRLVAVEVAEKRGFPYPKEADEYVTAWVTAAL